MMMHHMKSAVPLCVFSYFTPEKPFLRFCDYEQPRCLHCGGSLWKDLLQWELFFKKKKNFPFSFNLKTFSVIKLFSEGFRKITDVSYFTEAKSWKRSRKSSPFPSFHKWGNWGPDRPRDVPSISHSSDGKAGPRNSNSVLSHSYIPGYLAIL